MTVLLIFLLWLVSPAQRSPESVPDLLTLDGARPIIDNERVTVWDFTWSRGVPATMERRMSDSLWVSVAPSAGDVVYWPKGSERRAPRAEITPAHMIVIDLKDRQVAPIANTSGQPTAFPRQGARKAFENQRVVVWDYTWTLRQPTPMHFHDKDVVVVFLKTGALRSTTPDGQISMNNVTPGKTTFNARARVHTEQLVDGESRAIIAELK